MARGVVARYVRRDPLRDGRRILVSDAAFDGVVGPDAAALAPRREGSVRGKWPVADGLTPQDVPGLLGAGSQGRRVGAVVFALTQLTSSGSRTSGAGSWSRRRSRS